MQCGAKKVNGDHGECVCILAASHKGLHEDKNGVLWFCPNKTVNGDCGCKKN